LALALTLLTTQVIAQKFLHDAIYTLSTWSDIVCEMRPDLHNTNLHATERLILRHVNWRISDIANEEKIAQGVKKAHDEQDRALERYSKYLGPYQYSDEEDDSPDYTPAGHRSPRDHYVY